MFHLDLLVTWSLHLLLWDSVTQCTDAVTLVMYTVDVDAIQMAMSFVTTVSYMYIYKKLKQSGIVLLLVTNPC